MVGFFVENWPAVDMAGCVVSCYALRCDKVADNGSAMSQLATR